MMNTPSSCPTLLQEFCAWWNFFACIQMPVEEGLAQGPLCCLHSPWLLDFQKEILLYGFTLVVFLGGVNGLFLPRCLSDVLKVTLA